MKDLLRLGDLGPDDLAGLVEETVDVAAVGPPVTALARRTVLLRIGPHVDTHVAWSAVRAMGFGVRLGRGLVGHRGAGDVTGWMTGPGDVAVLAGGLDDHDLHEAAAACPLPVLNIGSQHHDPCGGLAALATVRERCSLLEGLRVACIGPLGPVVTDFVEGCAVAGASTRLALPPGAAAPAGLLERARAIASVTGADVLAGGDPEVAIEGADVVMVGRWEQQPVPAWWRVTDRLLADAGTRAVVLHADPAGFGDELDRDLAVGPRSGLGSQRRHVPAAVQVALWALVDGALRGLGAGVADELASTRH